MPRTRSFRNCPRCNAPLAKATAISGAPSEFWYACTSPRCNTYVNSYIPMAHQYHFHQTDARLIGNFGAFGTGKTTTSREELYKHVLITPNANALVGANIVPQYEQTLKRELDNDLPAAFIQRTSAQKQYYDLINNARILFRPFDNPNKLRSFNLTFFIMVEASEINEDAFHQLKTRLRNTSATIPLTDPDGNPLRPLRLQADWRKGIVESNPDSGWVRSELLSVANNIHKHGDILDLYVQDQSRLDPNIDVHVATTSVNPYLPPNYIEEISYNKPMWWVARYVLGSFNYSEGLVYPSAAAHIVASFDPPPHWPRLLACDYGLNDKFVYLLAAIEPGTGVVHIYREFTTTDRNIEYLAEQFKLFTEHIPSGNWYTQPILDPKSGSRRDYNKKDLFTHFLDHGIYFKPGHINLEARIYRLNTYLESGRQKIHDVCNNLKDEIIRYKFPDRTLDDKKRNYNKPVDKDNHSINALEWITMELPANPALLKLKAFGPHGVDLDAARQRHLDNKHYAEFALSDTSQQTTSVFDFSGGGFGNAW